MSWLFLALFCLSFFGSSADAAVKDSGVGIVKDSAAPDVSYVANAQSKSRISFVQYYTSEGWGHQTSIGDDGVFTMPKDVVSDTLYFGLVPQLPLDHGFYNASLVLDVPFDLSKITVESVQAEAWYGLSSNLGRYDGTVSTNYNRIICDFAFEIPMDDVTLYSFKIKFSSSDIAGVWTIDDFILPEPAEETKGLLESIISFIQNIYQAIVDLPAKIGAAFQAVGQFIIDGIKGLFLPSDGFFDEYWKQLNDFFSDRFGLLYFPIELTVDMVNRILKISQTDPYIQIPELAWDGHVFIPAQRYEFDFLDNPQFKQIHDYYLMAMDVAMIGALVALLWRKFEEVLKT